MLICGKLIVRFVLYVHYNINQYATYYTICGIVSLHNFSSLYPRSRYASRRGKPGDAVAVIPPCVQVSVTLHDVATKTEAVRIGALSELKMTIQAFAASLG
eukprot:scaffold616246_cov41-Prasinocladus_malaysianus.AAC.1